jgi:hypothetical protein
MKKIGFIVFAAAIIIGVAFSSLFSFGKATGKVFNFSVNSGVTGSGNIAADTRDVSDFSSIEVGGVFQVEIVAQRDFGVQVEADDNLLEFIKTEVHGDVLRIESDKRINSREPIRIRISAPNIERIEASGASKVTVADLNNSSLAVDTSGASKIRIAGQTARLQVEVSGASNIDAENLKAGRVDVEASGASQAAVNVVETLRTDASGASRVTYTGSPTSVQKNITGAGSVNQK